MSRYYHPETGSRLDAIESKSKPGELRAFTLADAKRMTPQPYPSVTTVLSTLAKPSLDNWKQSQAILACEKNPRQNGEDDTTYTNRVIAASAEHVTAAADYGTAMHALVENWAAWSTGDRKYDDYSDHYAKVMNMDACQVAPNHWSLVRNWLDENIVEAIGSERIMLDHNLKVGGTLDLKAVIRMPGTGEIVTAVIDFKTRKPARYLKDGTPRWNAHLEDAMQLSVYYSSDPNVDVMASVYIDRDGNHAPDIKVWEDSEVSRHYAMFRNLREIFRLNNGI